MYDRWVKAASSGKLSGVVFLDLSAAFDLVDHNHLLKKLEIYGVNNDVLHWVHSYLEDRSQAVWLDHVRSSFLGCKIGVPQGSILGPLFFLVYFNDLMGHLESSVDSYADDTTLTASGQSQDEIQFQLSRDCDIISSWMRSNALKINPEKTHVISVGTQKRLQKMSNPLEVRMDDVVLEQVSSGFEQVLGCKIQADLKFNHHVAALKCKFAKRLSGLAHLKLVCPLSVRKVIAEGFFNSVLGYCLPLFGGMDQFLLQELQVMQNRAARVVCSAPPLTRRIELLKKLGWLSVKQLIWYYTLILVFKIRGNKTPEYLAKFLGQESRSGRIRLEKQTLTLSLNSFCHRGANQWNQLPWDMRCQQKIGTFKKSLKKWIVKNVPPFSD